MSELVENGITTVVGLLGTDGITRSVDNLYAKTRVLCEEGVSAYMLTGAYGYPSPTITGETDRDIVFVNEILGVKLAISDHRAPNVTGDQLVLPLKPLWAAANTLSAWIKPMCWKLLRFGATR